MNDLILIVEDEKDLRDVYQLVLSSLDYDVDTAINGQEALQKIHERAPTLILLDLFMPVMGGIEFLRNFNSADYPNTKIIAYTNLSDGTTESEVLRLGAQRLVLKADMDPQDLVKLVQEMSSPVN
jgi:two-component system response regulator